MEQNINISFNNILSNYKNNILSKKLFICQKCSMIQNASLNSDNSSFISTSCKCGESQISLIDFFNLNWIEKEVLSYCNKNKIKVDNIDSLKKFEKMKFDVALECCHILSDISNDNNYISQFKEIEGDIDDIQIINRETLKKKLAILGDVKELKKKEFKEIYDKMNDVYEDIITNLNFKEDSSYQTFENIERSHIELLQSYYNALVQIELLSIMFMMYHNILKVNEKNHILLSNLYNFSHFSVELSYDLSSISISTNFEYKEKEIVQYFKYNNLLLSKESQLLFKNYETKMNISQVNVNSITPCKNREYGQHKVKINAILLLSQDTFALATSHSTIKIFNLKTMHCEMKFKGHKKEVNYLCLLGPKHMLSCSLDSRIIKWELSSSICRMELVLKLANAISVKCKLKDHSASVIIVNSFQKDKFISCSLDKTIKIWKDLNTPQEPIIICSVTEPEGNFITLKVIDDNRLITISDNKQLIVWRYNETNLIKENTTHNIECYSVNSISRLNSQHILIGGEHTLYIFDIMKNIVVCQVNEVSEISSFSIINRGNFICISKDTISAYSFSYNNLNKIFTLKNEQQKKVNDVRLIENKTLITVSEESTIQTWKCDITQ